MAKAAKKAGEAKKAIGKKPLSDAAALRAGYIIKSVTLITGGGRRRTEELQLIKTAGYRVKETRFLLHTLIDHKKKKLVLDVLEIQDGQQYHISALRQVQSITQLDLKAEKYEGYATMLRNAKEAISLYTVSPAALLNRDIRAGKCLPGQVKETKM